MTGGAAVGPEEQEAPAALRHRLRELPIELDDNGAQFAVRVAIGELLGDLEGLPGVSDGEVGTCQQEVKAVAQPARKQLAGDGGEAIPAGGCFTGRKLRFGCREFFLRIDGRWPGGRASREGGKQQGSGS